MPWRPIVAMGAVLAGCAAPAVPLPAPTVAPPTPDVSAELREPGSDPPPLATRGFVASVARGWLGPTCSVAFLDGTTPPAGTLLAVMRHGEQVGTLVVVRPTSPAWRGKLDDGRGWVIFSDDTPALVGRPSWDGDEPIRPGDSIVVRADSSEALADVRRPRFLE